MNTQFAPLSATRGYIGGGNCAGIMGLSPFKSPLDEYLVITGEVEDNTAAQEKFFARRKAFEPVAADFFQIETGLQIVQRNVRYVDHEHDFLRAEIDFETSDGGNGETKTVHPLAASQWGDPSENEPPPYVTAQVMHGLGITGKPHAWVHAMVGFDDDRVFRIERADDLIATIREREISFWQHNILPRRMPQPVSVEDLLLLYKRDSGRAVEADPEIVSQVLELLELRQQSKLLASKQELAELAIKTFMRDASTLTIRGLPAITWKAQDRTSLDTDSLREAYPEIYDQFKTTTSTRVLRIK